MARAAAGPAEPTSALSRLLEEEARLEAMLEAARNRAQALVAEAEAHAAASDAAVERELNQARTDSARRQADASAERLREMALAREAALEHLTRRRSDRMESLAVWVSEEVIASITNVGNGT